MNDDTLANAGITPKERLARIETILDRIDSKLDDKANRSDLTALEFRVRDLEVTGGPVVRELKDDVKRLTVEVSGFGKKLAYASGSVAVVVLVVNIAAAWLVGH